MIANAYFPSGDMPRSPEVRGEGVGLLLSGVGLEVHLSLQSRATCKLKFVLMETSICH